MRNKIDFSKPLMVASVDFEDSSIISLDNVYHSIKELIDWLFVIKIEVNKPFNVTLREFTIKEEDNLIYEYEFWEYDWENFFESKVIETFKM